jgi:ankyrin repeat protein
MPRNHTDVLSDFLVAASAPRHLHASGSLDEARALLLADPSLGASTIFGAAITGNDVAAQHLLTADPLLATTRGGPYEWDALTYLCFSRFLRHDAPNDLEVSARFTRVAERLLDAGASANSGFLDTRHQPTPIFESVLYGAAGLAQHAPITRLLLARGADPNDSEVPYHAPESYDLSVMNALLESGTLNAASLAMMLLRKTDWHDERGIERLLAYGVNPNEAGQWKHSPFIHAIRRNNRPAIIERMLDHGANPLLRIGDRDGDMDGVALTIWCGRRDLLALYAAHGRTRALDPLESIAVACIEGHTDHARALLASSHDTAAAFASQAPAFLARSIISGNEDAVRALLAVGVPVDSRFTDTDGYWGLAPHCTALHVAAWFGRHVIVRLLLNAGADAVARDSHGRAPLTYAVKACTNSHGMDRRAPDSVAALLAAGADARAISTPTGYAEIDTLLRP